MLSCWKVIVVGSVPEQILVPMSIVNRPPSQVHFVTALQHRMICYVLFCVMVYSRHLFSDLLCRLKIHVHYDTYKQLQLFIVLV